MVRRLLAVSTTAVVLTVLLAPPALAKRAALLIGNSAYQHTTRLENPRRDATALAQMFRDIGFDIVETGFDLGRTALVETLLTFADKAAGAEQLVIYYAGHGMEADGTNYLIPVDATLKNSVRLGFETVILDRVLEIAGVARGFRVIILDACRDNPLAAEMARRARHRSIGRGLARVEPAKGTLVAYAAKDGTTAADGEIGGHSPYAAALLEHLPKPGLDIRIMFGKVRDTVVASTSNEQEPFTYGSLPGREVHFVPPEPEPVEEVKPIIPTPPPGPPVVVDFDAESCTALRRNPTRAGLKMYLELFPTGACVGWAKVNLAILEPAPSVTPSEPEPTQEAITRPPEPPSPQEIERSIGLNRSGWRVIQRALTKLGHHVGLADGLPGRRTRRGISAWQRSAGRPVTGYLTASDHAALIAAADAVPEPEPAVGIYPQPTPSDGGRRGQVRRFDGIEFVWVPGGEFEMGCGSWTSDCYGDEKPVHRVRLDGFWLGKYEVTQGQWRRVMGSNPSRFKKGDNHPVEQVSWRDVQGFLGRLNGGGGGKYRLPTEAEWEYACRSGGRSEKYAGGSGVGSVAWYGSNSGGTTHPVGGKRANGLGLHDMSGNVWEWVQDVYKSDAYKGRRGTIYAPIYEGSGSYRVVRGGSWYDTAGGVRCAFRRDNVPGTRSNVLGFRLLRTP